MKKILSLLLLLLSLPTLAALHLTWASRDIHYDLHGTPPPTVLDTVIRAWRGERLGLQALAYADETVTLDPRLAGPRALTRRSSASFVGYVLTTDWRTCGYPPADLPARLVPDRIDQPGAQTIAAGELHPIWCTIEVPRHLRPGTYTLTLASRLRLRVEVLNRTLPRPDEQKFHLDLWQQPYSVARYYGVKPWSQQHLDVLRPYLQLLARAGQKVITTILFHEPWGEQSNDTFLPMIETRRRKDGTWAYDYTAFDRYVRLCHECGIRGQINCYSMVPWDMTFRYFDEGTNQYVDLRTTTSQPAYADLWKPFLQAFARHLRQKEWFDKTCIAMDERGLDAMLDAYRVAQDAVPGIRMALAGNYHPELEGKIHDYCLPYATTHRPQQAAVSTLYTCCTEPRPNLFTNNFPSDAAFLPLYCAARGYDGYLHWSWLNWTDDPVHDTRFRMFAPGDTYMVYPGPRTSVRFERLIEGIQQAEKARLLGTPLDAFTRNPEHDGDTGPLVSEIERVLNAK